MPRGGARRNRSWRSLPTTAPRGTIEIDAGAFGSFTADEGSSPFTPAGEFTVRSSSVGFLENVSASVRYTDGSSGWLSVALTVGAGRIVTGAATITPGALVSGTYTAVITVTDPNATNPAQEIPVTLTLVTPITTMGVTPSSRSFSATEGTAGTSQTVTISNAGGVGVMPTPTAGSITYAGGATGWISGVSIAGPTGGPWTATISSTGVGIAPGSYTATVPFLAQRASNSPQSVSCAMTVASAAPTTPTMTLSTSGVQLTAVAGSGATPSASVVVSSGNGYPLGTTSVGTITGAGASAVSTGVSTHTVTVTCSVGALGAGTYTASVPILDSSASNSPQSVAVTFIVTAAAAAWSVVPAEITTWGSPVGTSSLYVGGWVLPPGTMTVADVAARKLALFIDGVEQRLYTEAHPGRHPDGSVRSVGYEFNYTPASTSSKVCEVRIGTVRGTTDLTKTTKTLAHMWTNQAAQAWGVDAEPTGKLLPTDVAYLCACDAAFMPLQPATEDDAVSTGRFTTLFGQRATACKNLTDRSRSTGTPIGAVFYQATYESGRALVAAWCRTGTSDYVREALKQSWRLLEYSTSSNAATRPNPTNNVYAESRMFATDGNIAEAGTLRFQSFAICWQLSGYASFFAAVNAQHMIENSATRATLAGAKTLSGATGVIYQTYLIRANLRRMYCHVLAYMIGANRRQTTASGYGNRDMNFPVELPLLLEALDNVAYAKGDYRDGLRALNPASTDGIANGGTGTGAVPNFQINYINDFLMLYEREVYADPRIPGWIKTNTSVALQNAVPLTSGSRGYGYTDSQFGVTYWANPTAGGTGHCDYLGYMTGSIAYCAAKWPNDVVNGATFRTWYDRAADYKNNGYTASTQKSDWDQFSRAWKILGECFGFQMMAPYFIKYGVPNGASAINAIAVASSWPV